MNTVDQKRNKGFTLVEALVAISVLMVAVVSPITIAQKGLSSALFSKDQMIASFLAQDTIEFIKGIRDDNVKGDFEWLSGLTDCVQPGGIKSAIKTFCIVDSITVGGIEKADSNNAYLYMHSSLNAEGEEVFVYYTHEDIGNEKSKFKRIVNIRQNGTRDEALITVIVSWGGARSADNNVIVKAFIYNFGESAVGSEPVKETI